MGKQFLSAPLYINTDLTVPYFPTHSSMRISNFEKVQKNPFKKKLKKEEMLVSLEK